MGQDTFSDQFFVALGRAALSLSHMDAEVREPLLYGLISPEARDPFSNFG